MVSAVVVLGVEILQCWASLEYDRRLLVFCFPSLLTEQTGRFVLGSFALPKPQLHPCVQQARKSVDAHRKSWSSASRCQSFPPPHTHTSALSSSGLQVCQLPSAGAEAGDDLLENRSQEVPDHWEDLPKGAVVEVAIGAEDTDSGGLSLEGVSLTEKKSDESGDEGEIEEEREEGEPVAVMDERLLAAFLNGLKKTLKDDDLPMLVRCAFLFPSHFNSKFADLFSFFFVFVNVV